MMGASSSAMHHQARKSSQRRQVLQESPQKDMASGDHETNKQTNSEETVARKSLDPTEDKLFRGISITSGTADKDFELAWKTLDIPKHDIQSAKNIIKNNEDITDALYSSVQCVVSMSGTNENDSNVLKALETVNFLFFDISAEKRKIVGDFLTHLKYCPISFQKYKQLLQTLNTEHFEEENNSNVETSQIIYFLRSFWWNFSDCSTRFGTNLLTDGIIQEMTTDIKNMIGIDAKKLKYSFTFESAIGVLHNVAKIESHRQAFRDLKLVDILGNFLSYETLPKVTMLVLLTLALVIDEDRTELLFSHETSFDLLILLANRAWKMKDHRYDGFSIDELVLGLKGLSKNDKVKRLLVEKGILELVCKMLIDGTENETSIAAKLLWELSFDSVNRAIILENETIMGTLKSACKDASGVISRSAQGAMWVLEMESKKKKKAKLKKKEFATDKDESKTNSGHVMISYNWSDQKELLKIKDMLKSKGFKVWMDVENISGSTLQAMAEAVEGSLVVLVCMSEQYKESSNCRSEAEYAFALNKPIIPLLMQEKYKADGWLGILLGTKLFFDFSGRFSFDSKISELMKELKGHGLNTDEDATDGPIVKTAAPLAGKAPELSRPKCLSQTNVKAWILEHKLEKYPAFNSLEPAHALFLKKLSSKAPEFYYSLLMNMITGKTTFENLDALLQVTDAVDDLSS